MHRVVTARWMLASTSSSSESCQTLGLWHTKVTVCTPAPWNRFALPRNTRLGLGRVEIEIRVHWQALFPGIGLMTRFKATYCFTLQAQYWSDIHIGIKKWVFQANIYDTSSWLNRASLIRQLVQACGSCYVWIEQKIDLNVIWLPSNICWKFNYMAIIS